MESEELNRNSVFRPLVENIKTDIGVSALVFHVDTETGREFKYLDAISNATQPRNGDRNRRQSRLDMQMNDARATGAFRTKHNSTAFSSEQASSAKKLTGNNHATIDRFGASTMFQPQAADSKEAKKRMRARKRKGQFQKGEDLLRDDLKMCPPVHKILPIKLLRKFDSEQPDLAPRRRARPKVLIVDGNRIHLGACHAIYVKYFEIVQCVPTADQAMDLLDHIVFDIVLVAPDLSGELSGLDLVDAIRSVEEKSRHVFRSLIIAALTPVQSKDQTLLDACFCSGMDRFLVKPAIMYVHLLCDLMVGGTSSDAFRRLALETQWVSNHDAMIHVLGDDPNSCAGIMRIVDAEGTEEIRQREVAAMMETDTDRQHVDGLHERQRREELQRIVNATAQMKRRILDLENEVEVLEEERARRAYTESRNLHTLLALETRLKEAEHELHEKSREAQQLRNKSEEYRIDLKNLLDNGCVNAEQVAKAKQRVRHYQKLVEASESTAMSRLDASDQRKWSNYYGDAAHRSHFEVEEYVPKFATDASASWYRSELTFLGNGVSAALQSVERAFDDMKSRMNRCMMTDSFDRDAIINVVRDQLGAANRNFATDILSLKRTVNETVASLLLRELHFWKLLEDDEPRLLREFGQITSYLESLRTHLEDRSHATQTETFPWDQQTTKDLENIAKEMMDVSSGDAGISVLMENSYPRLPDGSYNAESHAQVEVFRLPVHLQQALLDVPQLRVLNPLLPLTRGDVFTQEKSRRIVFGAVFEKLQELFSVERTEKQAMTQLINKAIRKLHTGETLESLEAKETIELGNILVRAAEDAAKTVDAYYSGKASTRSAGCSPFPCEDSEFNDSPSTTSVGPSLSTPKKTQAPSTPSPPPPAKRGSKSSTSSTSSPQAQQLPSTKRPAPMSPSKPLVHNAPTTSTQSSAGKRDLPLGSQSTTQSDIPRDRRSSSISASAERRLSSVLSTDRRISVSSTVTRQPTHRTSSSSIASGDATSATETVDAPLANEDVDALSAPSLELNPPSNEALAEALATINALSGEIDQLRDNNVNWRAHVSTARGQIVDLLLEARCQATERLFSEAATDTKHKRELTRELMLVRTKAAKDAQESIKAKQVEHTKEIVRLKLEFETASHQHQVANQPLVKRDAAREAISPASDSDAQLASSWSSPTFQVGDVQSNQPDSPLDGVRRRRGNSSPKHLFNIAVSGGGAAKADMQLQIGFNNQPEAVEAAKATRTKSVDMYHQVVKEEEEGPSMCMSSFAPSPPAPGSIKDRGRVIHPKYELSSAGSTIQVASHESRVANDHFLPLLPGRNTDRCKAGETRVFQGLISEHTANDDANSATILMTTSFPTKKKAHVDQKREKALAEAFSRYQIPVSQQQLPDELHPARSAGNCVAILSQPKPATRQQILSSPTPAPMLQVGNFVNAIHPSIDTPRISSRPSRSPLQTRPPPAAHSGRENLNGIILKTDTTTSSNERSTGTRHEKLAALMS